MRSVAVLVAGAGASGMIAALTAKKNGNNVILLEKNAQAGKKILATGNGKCNYTNYYQSPECYRSFEKNSQTEESFAWHALGKFGQQKTVEMFRQMGIMPSDRDGYVYPMSGQAVSVRNIIYRELIKNKVDVHLEEEIIDIEIHYSGKTGEQDGYLVKTTKDKYLARKLIIATGGKAYPVHGSDGFAFEMAVKLGHTVVKPLPALTSCILDEKFTKEWAGVRVGGKVSAYNEENRLLCSDSGELQLVAAGISGIPVFQISRFIAAELAGGRNPYIVTDIMPEYTKEEIIAEIKRRIEEFENASAGDVFEGFIHIKLVSAILMKAGIKINKNAADFSDTEINNIAGIIKGWRMNVVSVADFDKAQVTCGGVSVDEINPDTMESKICKNLYFTGECIDVDGICGGYNLQWAWTSGYIAGSSC